MSYEVMGEGLRGVRSFEEIVQTVKNMQNAQGPAIEYMRQILRRYNGDYIVPLPDVANEPTMPALTPALVADAVDSMAMRAASTRPVVKIPALDPRLDQGPESREFATIRRKIIGATYYKSRWKLGRRRYYRHLAAYSTCSMWVVPDFKLGHPILKVRDPLGTFVEPQIAEDLSDPEYVAFVTQMSAHRLRTTWPMLCAETGGPIAPYDVHNAMWDVLEWIDRDQIVFGLMGPSGNVNPRIAVNRTWVNHPFVQLGPAYPNKAHCALAAVPSNLSLGQIVSRLGAMLGNVDLQAKLMALSILAQEKAIFPDTYAIGREGRLPAIVGGKWKDGREGDINLLMDVESVGTLRTAPDARTDQSIDRLERNFRVSTSLVPQTGGETYGALRTGRGIDALTSMALDPRIQELHEISEEYVPVVNRAILGCYKAWWGEKQYRMFSGWPGDMGELRFTPNTHIETVENVVAYTIPGADVIQTTQILGSMLGTKAISLQTFRDKHPWIEDPEAEHDMVNAEEMEDALRQSIMQQLVSGALPMVLSTAIHRHLRDGLDLFEAVEAADKELREMQATEAPEPDPASGMIAAPETMPGLAAGPGAAMAPAPAPQIAVPNDVTAMRQLMTAYRGG